MALSTRGREMPASPIRKLVPRADAAKKRGVSVFHLNIGQPDLETPRGFFEAVRQFDAPVLEYAHSEGIARVREAMSGYYQRTGIAARPEQMVVTTGGSEALLFALTAVTDPGDDVLVFEPYYTNYGGFARMLGITLRPVATFAERGYHLPSREEIAKAIGPRTRAILVCNPGNPTGTVLGKAELDTLAQLAIERDLFLISDEVYREFVYDGGKAISVLGPESSAGLRARAVIIDSVSKRFSLCGARVGALVSHDAELIASATRMAQARLSAATIEQLAAAALMEMPERYYADVRAEYQRRRDVVYAGLRAIPGAVCERPEGAFYVFAKLPLAKEEGRDAEAFASFLLDEFSDGGETVMVAPGPGFYATPGLGRDEIRIAYVLNTSALGRAMELLRLGVERFNSRK
jgi:aspartate aminotransferase